jgi:predicted esterase
LKYEIVQLASRNSKINFSQIMNPLIIPASSSTAKATMIFLHGLGDSGHGWANAMKYISSKLPFIKFILPHAPSRPVTINGGAVMPAWYDIYSLNLREHRDDKKGIIQSRDSLLKLIGEEKRSGQTVFVGGFSQGAVIALLAGLSCDSLAGIVSLSGYFALKDEQISNKKSPVFMAHGTEDLVINHEWGKNSAEILRGMGISVEFKSYSIGHEAVLDELDDVVKFIQRIISTEDREL